MDKTSLIQHSQSGGNIKRMQSASIHYHTILTCPITDSNKEHTRGENP